MFAGKTEALIGRLTEASRRGERVQIFKPLLDDRYAEDVIMSHNSNSLPALPVRKAKDIPVSYTHLTLPTIYSV